MQRHRHYQFRKPERRRLRLGRLRLRRLRFHQPRRPRPHKRREFTVLNDPQEYRFGEVMQCRF